MKRIWAGVVLGLAVLFALSPLASDGFNGFTPTQFPVIRDWPVQPVGWAFSIWGLIYGWLIAGSLYGLARAPQAPGWQAMRPALGLSLGLGVFWIAVANLAPVAATAMILVMAAAAIAAMLRAGNQDRLWLAAPIGLYAGWLTAASGVALGVVLGGHGILAAQVAALTMLASVLGVAMLIAARRPQVWTYPLAVGWAALGIAVKNLGLGNPAVWGLALAGIAVLGLQYLANRRRVGPGPTN